MRVVPLEELGGLIEAWARRWAVFSPSREAGVVAFRPWRGEPFWQWYRNATLPPKELFLPRQEELFRFEGLREALPEQEFLVCGIRPCDARALELLDRVFEAEPADPHWTGRRRRALLVGFACTEPCEASFCVDLGVDPLEAPGVDLMVLPWEGRAYLWANTDRGHGLLEGAPQEGELPAGLAEQVRSRFPRGLPLEGARRGMEAALAEEGRWRELAFGCVTCGVCTLLCPTCHCFEAEDDPDRRWRRWDSCAFLPFTQMPMENPRAERWQRVRQRLCHKFLWFPQVHGQVACVGCGRCVRLCPTNWDLRRKLEALAGG